VGLQIANSAADLLILGIAGRLPERSGRIVLEGDQGGYSTDAVAVQIVLAGPRQREADALSTVSFVNGESIHVASPPVPAGNQGPDNLIAALGNQKGRGGIRDQAFDVGEMVCPGCVLTSRLRPKLQDGLRVLEPASTYGEPLASQAGDTYAATCSPAGT
jgi:hypothetical protein